LLGSHSEENMDNIEDIDSSSEESTEDNNSEDPSEGSPAP